MSEKGAFSLARGAEAAGKQASPVLAVPAVVLVERDPEGPGDDEQIARVVVGGFAEEPSGVARVLLVLVLAELLGEPALGVLVVAEVLGGCGLQCLGDRAVAQGV